jgi:hypothetical protein
LPCQQETFFGASQKQMTTQSNKCPRCGENFVPKGWVRSRHFATCRVVVRAQLQHRELRKIYSNLDSTPPATLSGPNVDNYVERSGASVRIPSSSTYLPDDAPEMTPQQHMAADANKEYDPITPYLDSLPLFDPVHVRECLRWGPKPSVITPQARKTIQFLSCTSMDDGLTRSHMTAILKFVKSLKGPDSALLPKTVDACWNVMEKVFPKHTKPSMYHSITIENVTLFQQNVTF